METMWLKEALFAGNTANAFKLGTVLTLGWFWPRVNGCSVLYRGASMETIDFTNILAVGNLDAEAISPPSYIRHNSSTTYYYVIRRVNSCGDQEYTLAAAAKVVIDADGDLAQFQPNDIFVVKAERVSGNKVQLLWYYCPLEQESEPSCFKVYYDGGTGQIDYENEVTTISYIGRRFYTYQSNALSTGTYLFAIRAENTDGVDDASLAQIEIQLNTTNPETISILSTEIV